MAKLFGGEYTKLELLKRVGDLSQVADFQPCVLQNGKEKGVLAYQCRTGGGLRFTVLPDRGMDIAWAEYMEKPLSFISKTGVVSPAMYDERGMHFLRSFFAGTLTTCGLTQMGAACEDQGQPLGQHGRISNTPAADVAVSKKWEGDEYRMSLTGTMRQSRVFEENLTLTRKITASLGGKKFLIEDTVVNEGFDRQPFMLLYHMNFGFPLVDQGARVFTCGYHSMRARDQEAQKGIDSFADITAPVHGYAEQVYYYDLKDREDVVYAGVYNPKQKLGVYIKYFKSQLPYMIEWKQVGEGDYTVGLEPATWYPEGRAEARRRGELAFIEPWEEKHFNMEYGIIDGELPDEI